MRAWRKKTRQPYCIYLTAEELDLFLTGHPNVIFRMQEAFRNVLSKELSH